MRAGFAVICQSRNFRGESCHGLGGFALAAVVAQPSSGHGTINTRIYSGAITVVAIDFVRGVVVIQKGPGQYEPVRFDPKTLQVY